jgi:hypothetical protein
VIWTLIAQLRGISVVGPIYFFVYYIVSSVNDLVRGGRNAVAMRQPWRMFPVVCVAYLVPHFLMYLSPTITSRNFWTWIWQPFPIWGNILSEIIPIPTYFLAAWKGDKSRPTVPVKTIAFFTVLSILTFWYTLSESELSPKQLYVPASLVPSQTDLQAAVRSGLQWDQICAYAGAWGWLALEFADLKRTGLLGWSWSRIVGSFVAVLVAGGPGVPLLLGWLVRESCLVDAVTTSIGKRPKKE